MVVYVTRRRNRKFLVTSTPPVIASGFVSDRAEAWPKPGDELWCEVCELFVRTLFNSDSLGNWHYLETRRVELIGNLLTD